MYKMCQYQFCQNQIEKNMVDESTVYMKITNALLRLDLFCLTHCKSLATIVWRCLKL